VHHTLIKVEFLSFQNVSVTSSGLSRSGSDFGIKTSRSELMVQGRFQSSIGLSLFELGGDLLGDGGQIDGWLGGLSLVLGLLESNLDSVVSLVP